jgi:transglutaminase/protease-like cytokinesis protein 3
MKRCIIILPLLLLTVLAFTQSRPASDWDIDRRVTNIATAAAPELALAITAPYTTDREKARAIFSWIAQHIAYRVKNTRRIKAPQQNSFASEEYMDTTRWKTANDVVAEMVLRSQSAVCDGYARLFKTLCDYAGIPAVIVTGYARDEVSRSGVKFRANHNWNAVYTDSAWHLLDVTWASGYTSYFGDAFIQHFSDYYFFTDPKIFIEDHFPDDLQWTLLATPPAVKEFERAPYRPKPFIKYNIVSYQPANGLIDAAVGDTIHIELETSNADADRRIGADSTCFNNDMLANYLAVAFLQPNAPDNARNRKINYTYVVEKNDKEWLQLIYNKDIIMQYRLKIRK